MTDLFFVRYLTIKLVIIVNGELVAPNSEKYINLYDPSSGKVYSQVLDSDASDVEQAIKAAQAAFPAWEATSITNYDQNSRFD